MEKTDTAKTKVTRLAYTALLCIVAALIVILAIGTIIALVRGSKAPLVSIGGNTSQSGSTGNDDIRVFSGLGRLRITLSNSSVLILSIAFPYQASDITFTEELAGKIGEFKEIASEYFSSLPHDKIVQIDEDAAKQEILSRFNAALRLGKINVLYFNDMMILDAN